MPAQQHAQAVPALRRARGDRTEFEHVAQLGGQFVDRVVAFVGRLAQSLREHGVQVAAQRGGQRRDVGEAAVRRDGGVGVLAGRAAGQRRRVVSDALDHGVARTLIETERR
ncbi:hypothetical protein, partial [Tahibacter caeni]|uniref:hypothetical protein n=1 Tax=Tahibacter caeni TaxID=1453545 RepID=UPI0021480DBB